MQKIFAPCPEFSYSYPTDFFYTRSVALNFSSTCSADASDSSVAYEKNTIISAICLQIKSKQTCTNINFKGKKWLYLFSEVDI